MKKIVSLTLSLLLCFCAACSLTACGQNAAVGNYETYCVFVGGRLYKVGDMYRGTAIKKDYVSAKVNNDHTLSVTLHDGATYTYEGTWMQTDEFTYRVAVQDSTYTITVNDNFVQLYIRSDYFIYLKK